MFQDPPSLSQTGKFKFIDLFAGIGGFHLGLHYAGGECVFASEWDNNARKTYELNLKKIDRSIFEKNLFAGDITKVSPSDIPDFDILCGGFPCQPFSNAGHRLGFDDPRGNLFFTIAEIIKVKQPKAFFLENVRHLLKHDEGKTFAQIQKTLSEDLGYSFFYKVIKGTDFGVPQHRPRLFIVGFKDTSIEFSFPQPIPLKTSMSDIFGGKCTRDIGFTLRVGGRGSGINDRRNWDRYLVDGKEIQLNAEHGKKLQGFPDDFEFPVSEAQSMKQLGNSVAIPVIEAVARRIILSLQTKYLAS